MRFDLIARRMLLLLVEALPAAIVLVPLFLYLHKKIWHSRKKTLLYLVFALYLSGMYAAAGLPHIRNFTFQPRMNFTFFAYMFTDYSSVLNVLFFIPLGFLLPMIWTRFRAVWRTIPFGLVTSFIIEAMQIFTYRATDVNDLMTNTVGAVIGYCLAMVLQWIFPVTRPDNKTWDVCWICGIVTAVMFFVHPFLSQMLY